MSEILTSDMPAWNSIELHVQGLWDRAKRERILRTEKWYRNLATQRGECIGIGGPDLGCPTQ